MVAAVVDYYLGDELHEIALENSFRGKRGRKGEIVWRQRKKGERGGWGCNSRVETWILYLNGPTYLRYRLEAAHNYCLLEILTAPMVPRTLVAIGTSMAKILP